MVIKKEKQREKPKARILIAEDDAATRKLLETYIAKWGYDVVAASDGNRAWEILQAPDPPRLVILDWIMPGIDGLSLCKKIRQLAEGSLFHVILLTARETMADLVSGFAAGADDYIRKQSDYNELQARINVGCRIIELQTDLACRVSELENALAHIKTLQGILPICMHCHKIRDDKEVWQRLEEYITEHTPALLSHSLCPECLDRYYSDIVQKKRLSKNNPEE